MSLVNSHEMYQCTCAKIIILVVLLYIRKSEFKNSDLRDTLSLNSGATILKQSLTTQIVLP